MTNAIRNNYLSGAVLKKFPLDETDWSEDYGDITKWWLKHRDEAVRDEKQRIASRLQHMFVNAPETYHAIKQIIYS